MKDWTVWNWIAYGSLVIAAFGMAVGTVLRNYPELLARGPAFLSSPRWSFVPAILVIIATLTFFLRPSVSEPRSAPLGPLASSKNFKLSLQCYADNRYPTALEQSNVWGWFYFRSIFGLKNTETGEEKEFTTPILFISFDRPVTDASVRMQSPDFKLPRYEVKQFNQRYAVISFADELPAGRLDIDTY